MRALLAVAARSAWNRRGTLSLVVLSIALATALLLSLERLRTDIRASFAQAVSGTDLVVGARTGPIQLMLYSVFRVGGATNNIRMESVRAVAAHRAVAWTVPISLGDSHRGFPVLGTTTGYFEHFRYGDKQPLKLAHLKAPEMVLLEEGHCLRDQALEFCNKRYGSQAHVVATSIDTLRYLVAMGAGYTLMPALAVRPDPALDALLAFRPFEGTTPTRLIGLVYRVGAANEASVLELARILKKRLPKGVTAAE